MAYRWTVIGVVVLLLLVGLQGERNEAFAQRPDKDWICKIISVQGRVLVKRLSEAGWQAAGLNDTLSAGDQIRVEADSRAGIVLSNDAVLRLDQNTTLVLTEIEKETTFIFKLLRGAANFFSRRARSLKIFTPFVNGVVEGTEFYVRVDAEKTRIDLFEGRILAQNPYGELHLVKGQGAIAMAGSAPQRRLLVQPRDSVQWALYYPPVLVLGPDEVPDELRESLKLYNQGQTLEAVDHLEEVEENAKDARFFAYRAALLLHLGRISQARRDIGQALAAVPDHGEALALQAVIAVVQNRKAEALKTAQQAVQVNPQSAAAQMALSYAHQTGFDLTGALKAAQAAVKYAPENGTAWARLAELRLSTGKLDQGIQAARKAVQLNPNVAHAHTILGFAYLTQIKTEKARKAFEKAITLDSAAPLPRLGLGLAKIRDGDLEQGRSEIEIAAGLDPANALIRSYLGKAYFDEKRGPLDEKQLEIAKTLDPNDPTPWFYDAIRKQTLNRPVEALHDLQKSIALNDNRAVYRSRLLLDEDLAARSAGLGRIYNDLEFQLIALLEGYKSLQADPTNYSAHRLLADNYAAKPRHEIARVSELLQAQLFQPLNLTPIQAQLAESDTNLITGAGPPGLAFYEFNPLFVRNRLAFQGSAILGEDDTWGREITGSGVYDALSVSISSFHYDTDGFRQNNDITKDLFNTYVQGRLSEKTSIQAEFRNSEAEIGDTRLRFDNSFSEFFREEEQVTKYRFGGHHVFSPNLETILSYMHTRVEIDQTDFSTGFPTQDRDSNREREGDLIETRWDYQANRLKITAGLGYLRDDAEQSATVLLGPPFNSTIIIPPGKDKICKKNIYVYSQLKPFKSAEITLGASGELFEYGNQLEHQQFNPKIGLVWRPTDKAAIRLAALRVLSHTLVSTQTVEPTNVSGFNQFFEEQHGTDVRQYGAAVQYAFLPGLYAGVEGTRRYLEVPQYGLPGSSVPISFLNWEEERVSAYLYWTPTRFMGLSAEYQFEQLDRGSNSLDTGVANVDTHRVPVGLTLFSPWGFSFKLLATYISQEGDFRNTFTGPTFPGEDNFWICDAQISYRLPRRYGILSAGVKNVFDQEFNFQDTDPANPTVTKERFSYAALTLSF